MAPILVLESSSPILPHLENFLNERSHYAYKLQAGFQTWENNAVPFCFVCFFDFSLLSSNPSWLRLFNLCCKSSLQ